MCCTCSLTTLPELVTLDLSDNCFTKLPATFNDLKKLVSIDLRGNQSLTSLTASIRSMETLNEIRVGGCESLTSPPYQDCKNGVQAIKEYYESLDQGKIIELPMATVIVVGETRAGKSRLIKHLREPSIAFDLDQTTRAFEVTELQFQKPLPILEFGGGKTYQFAHRLMQKENCLPVVVVSMKEFEDRYTVQGISAKKVVQALIFNWINHFYFPYSGLNSPKLVLTHKDAFSDDPQKFFELKSILLQACNSVIKDIKKFEEGKYEPNEISDKKDLFDFFGERDVFEIGAHHTDIEIIIRLRDDLYQNSNRYKRSVAETYDTIKKVLLSADEPIVNLNTEYDIWSVNLQVNRSLIEATIKHLHDSSQLLLFKGSERLNQFLFPNIGTIAEMIEVLFPRNAAARRVCFIRLFSFNSIENKQAYEECYANFSTSGLIEEKLLFLLLKFETAFCNKQSMDVAVALLESFQLLFKHQWSEEKVFYVLPFSYEEYFSNHLHSPEENLKFRTELRFTSLLVDFAVYQWMVATMLNYSLGEKRTVVKQNGIQITTNFSKAQLTFDFEAKRAVLQLATKPKYVGIGWRQIQELTNDLINQVVNFLSTENFTCKSFCPHCLVEKRVPPFTTTNPNWCTLSTEAQQERQLCNTGMNVPEALLSPRK